MLLAGFSWRAVQNTPPFDERAFHLTLPLGRTGGFRRILGQHVLLFGCIGVMIAGRCLYLGASLLAGLAAALLLCLPFMALCAAIAVTASLASGGGKWRALAWGALIIPFWGTIYLLEREDLAWFHARGGFDFAPTGAAVLGAALLYPLGWCLVGLLRMKAAGSLMLGATGALLPLLAVYGVYGEGHERQAPATPFWLEPVAVPAPALALRPASEGLVRKIPPDLDDSWSWGDAADLLEPRGLGEGEFLQILEVKVPDAPRNLLDSPLWVGRSGARTLWGEKGFIEQLRTRIPAHEQFEYWAGPLAAEPPSLDLVPRDDGEREVEKLVKISPWGVRLSGPIHWEAAEPVETVSGGASRLACGRFVRVFPMREGSGVIQLTIRCYTGWPAILDSKRFGWLAGKFAYAGRPQILLMNASGKTAYGLTPARNYSNPGKAVLMGYEDWTVAIGIQEESAARLETLREGRLYIFLPVSQEGGFGDGVLPPP
jgi:hypothetical protein